MEQLDKSPALSGGSLKDALDEAAKFLPSALMSQQSFQHTRAVADLFPSDAIRFFGFESRLAAGAMESTDCALNFAPSGAALLADQAIGPDTDLWQRIAKFHTLWAASHSTPFTDAPATWLEFDAAARTPEPNILFGYWPDDGTTERPWSWMQDTIFPTLFAGNYGPELRASVERCFTSLPPEASDFQIGLMLSRPIQAVRLCVFDIPVGKVAAYLESIGWAGDMTALSAYIDAFTPHCDFVGLHLDIGAQVFPHIGIEPNFKSGSWSRQPHREPRWHGQFDVLRDFGLMDPAKHQALLDWVGHSKILHDNKPMLLLRGLSHIKVVLAPNGAAEAKAYFGIGLADPAQQSGNGR